MAELKITFKGICGHYTGVVPGVPHRVVMPDASSVRFGMVRCPDGNLGLPMAYCLLPHQVMWSTPDTQTTLLAPARMRVVNATADRIMDYRSSYAETVPPISDYVPRFNYSREVVLAGRAAAYFDVFGGKVTASPTSTGAVTVQIEIETDGDPVFGLMPFGLNGFNAKEEKHTFPSGTKLTVANSDIDQCDEDKPFDFLLHYLAAEEGIPALLQKATPGLGDFPKSQDWQEMATALRGLACVIEKHGPRCEGTGFGVMNASCSDTRYP